MKILFQGICLLLLIKTTSAQDAYADSLYRYQEHYKKELFPIIRKDTEFVRFYPLDQSYLVTATVQKLAGQSFFPMATTGTISKDAVKYAEVSFSLFGKPYTLYAYRLSMLMNKPEYKEDFFIPFTDSLSGLESYGGGKYLDFVTGDITPENKMVIDFNKSYNPYCAFRSGYNCPIPPKENDLPLAIRAGEMKFGKTSH